MNEQERAALLGRAWDTFRRMDLERCDPNDVATMRSLIALDRLPLPDPRFVARLEGALTGTGAASQLPPLHWQSVQAAGPVVDHGEVWSLPELPVWSRRPALARWAAAGMAVFICGALAFLALQAGNNDDDNPTFLPAYGDASTVALPWQETSECDVPARTGDSFRTLLPLSAGELTPTPPPDEAGTTANISTVAAIEATTRELVSCHNAQQPGRFYALWTNTAILWTNRIMTSPQDGSWLESIWQAVESTESANGTPERGKPAEIWTVEGIEDIQVLTDGRVRATVRYGTPSGEFAVLTHFDQRDGAYLLDAAAGWTYSGSAAQYPWSNLLATPGPVAETGPTRSAVTSGDTGADAIGGDILGPDATAGDSSIVQDTSVPVESMSPGDTSASTAVGGTLGGMLVGPSSWQPTPSPTENVNPGNTSGGTAVGGAATGGAGNNLPLRPTPSPADN